MPTNEETKQLGIVFFTGLHSFLQSFLLRSFSTFPLRRVFALPKYVHNPGSVLSLSLLKTYPLPSHFRRKIRVRRRKRRRENHPVRSGRDGVPACRGPARGHHHTPARLRQLHGRLRRLRLRGGPVPLESRRGIVVSGSGAVSGRLAFHIL
jgi:hypothetical protein